LKEDSRLKHKFDIAKSWVLNKIRSEERKKVTLLNGPFKFQYIFAIAIGAWSGKLAKLDTDELAEAFMKIIGACDSEGLTDTYVRNLALL
jgi:hypothetical protein